MGKLTEREITLGSLFDGAGGFPHAGMMAGITPIWASEIEPFPIRITSRRFPKMKHLGNIADVDGGKIDPVDIITFGSPCQDLSVAGNRAGLDGERSGLFREAVRIIKEMREKTNGEKPRYIVWENVPGAFSSNKGEDFRTVLEEIARIKSECVSIPRPEKGKWSGAGEIMGDGFSIAWRTYDAQYWGVPQRRKRIYLVGDFGGGNAGKIQFESDRLCRDFEEGGREGQGTAGASEGDSGTPGRRPMESTEMICLNDQGGSTMDITEGITGTIRAEMHGNTPIVLKERAGCPGGGKGAMWQNDKAYTLSCHSDMTVIAPKHYEGYQHQGYRESEVAGTLTAEQNNHVRGDTPIVIEQTQKAETAVMAFHLTQDPSTEKDKSLCISTGNPKSGQATVGVIVQKPTVYGLSSKGSNAWKSSNPHSGCYEAETTRTLDTRGGDPTCAQGGEIIIQAKVFENHGQDTRFRDTGEICQTVTQKYGTGGGNTPIVVQQKAYSIGNGQTHSLYLDEKARTLDTMHDAQAIIAQKEADDFPYIARRLMPIECSRLQGYPDWWTAEIKTEEPTEEEISWWMEVFETHRKATKPNTKPRTRNQVRKWLTAPQTDSAEYRMWGNSLAIPNAYQVLAGIAEEISAEPERPMYICSWSGGKDSTASIILAHEHGEPLDLIIFSEVMFDSELSGELPEQIDFVKNKAIPLFESWGYKVRILHANQTYMGIFMRYPCRGKRKGMGLRTGFPMAMKCGVNREVKVKPIQDFLKSLQGTDYRQYVGIAIDEPKRLERAHGKGQISLLEKYGFTEEMAKEKCEEYGLLSPVYEYTSRGGCWFCPNSRKPELRHLRDSHPELWQKLLDLEKMPDLIGSIWNGLEKKSIHMMEEQFRQEDAQLTIFDFLDNTDRRNDEKTVAKEEQNGTWKN